MTAQTTLPAPASDRVAAVEARVAQLSAELQDLAAVLTADGDSDLTAASQWVEHAEAVLRLEALWRSWETLRLDPNLGMATWLTNFLDPQLAALTAPQGTFAKCSPDRHG
jgi:hypothetical protein